MAQAHKIEEYRLDMKLDRQEAETLAWLLSYFGDSQLNREFAQPLRNINKALANAAVHHVFPDLAVFSLAEGKDNYGALGDKVRRLTVVDLSKHSV